MANIPEHNVFLYKVMHDQKHFKHILTNDDITRMTMVEQRYPISKLPVCGHCERLAYWGKGLIAVCPHCGTTTLNPITLAEYYLQGYDLDGATGEDRAQVKHERIARKEIIPEGLKI
jgi:hypothetical protein